MIYIFDLDGTLANIDHRLRYIQGEKKDWETFYKECVGDAPIHATLSILKALQKSGAEIYILTGRSDEVANETINWLDIYGIVHGTYRLIMRPEGNHRRDDILKKQWYVSFPKQIRGDIVAVFEDRENVVAMWRELGVMCYQVVQ